MINKEDFVKIITEYKNWIDRVHQVADVLGIGILDSDWMDYPNLLFLDFIKSHFDEEGVDWINWWLFEKPSHNVDDLKAWDAHHNEIPTETVEDLWNIVESHRLNDFEFLDKKE